LAHELGSVFILIHPPLAILGYLFTFIAAKKMWGLLRGREGVTRKMDLRIALTIAWWLTFAGLVTGMIWARIAWGRFWSWDPKETMTLVIFTTLTLVYFMHVRKISVKVQATYMVINILSIIGTLSVSFIDIGLHSFG
jgi:ABC-type transport system involved in cytochrome c biogenesis permease subunit